MAPIKLGSGTLRGLRHIIGGGTNVRRVLYVAALVACKHKLRVILDAIAGTKSPWGNRFAAIQ